MHIRNENLILGKKAQFHLQQTTSPQSQLWNVNHDISKHVNYDFSMQIMTLACKLRLKNEIYDFSMTYK